MKVWEWLAKAAPGTYYFTDEIEALFKAETGLEPPDLSHHSFDASDWFDGLSQVIGQAPHRVTTVRSLALHSAGRPVIFGFTIAAACAEHFAGVKHEREGDAHLSGHQCGCWDVAQFDHDIEALKAKDI
jgi:hypothetical protein